MPLTEGKYTPQERTRAKPSANAAENTKAAMQGRRKEF